MKNRYSLILTILMILLVSGCLPQQTVSGPTGDSLPTDRSVQKSENQIDNSAIEDDSVEDGKKQNPDSGNSHDQTVQHQYMVDDYVSDYVDTELEWTDSVGNECEVSFEIPLIQPFSDDAISAQKEIEEQYLTIYNETLKAQNDGFSTVTSEVDYEAWLTNDVLTVLIEEVLSFDMTLYNVYQFDLSTGKRLDNRGLIGKLGFVWDDCWDAAAKAAGEYFLSCYFELSDEFRDDFYDSQYEKTISDQNIENAQFFITQESKLMMAVDIYSIAGADSYPQIVEIPVWFHK